VTGDTSSGDFPTQNPLQASNGNGGSDDAFILRIASSNWQDLDLAVGSDHQARILWLRSDGAIRVASVDNSGNIAFGPVYGPYAWIPQRIAAGADGYTRLLWVNTAGQALLWLMNANNTHAAGFVFGPY
jgi:hypothetical protein